MNNTVSDVCVNMEPIEHFKADSNEVVAIQTTALMSIAVSLKRIADAIEGSPTQLGLVSGIMTAIEQGALAAKQI